MVSHKRRALEGLRRLYEADTALAKLRVAATQYVPGEGSLSPLAVVLGEAPGANEDKQGRPFVGRAGELLVSLFETYQLQRDDFYLTNVVKYRPVKNRTPTPHEVRASYGYLVSELDQVSTGHVIAMGRVALDAMFLAKTDKGAPPVSLTHGYYYENLLDGKIVWSTYHPSAALYRPELVDVLIDDFGYILEHIRS